MKRLLAMVMVVGVVDAGAVGVDECVRTALAVNPGVEAAGHRVAVARAMIEQARSAYYPRLSLSGQFARTDNPPQAFMMALNQRALNMADPAFDPNEPDDTDNVRFSAGAKIRLLDGGQRRRHVKAARLGGKAAAEQLRAVRNQLVYEVTRGYYGVLQAEAMVTVQAETVQSLEESLRVARERLAAGSAVKTDVLNLEVKLAGAREDSIRARNGGRLAVAALNTAIGEPLVTEKELPVPPRREAGSRPVEPGPEAVENRPELAAVRQMTGAREQAYRAVVRDRLPTLNAFGSYDWDSDALDDFEASYLVGVGAEWEFFSGFERRGAVRKARAQWAAAQAEERQAVDNLRLDLKQSYLALVDAWERVGVTGRSVESAVEALRITTGRYEEGAADITELLTAQVGLTAIRTRDVAAYYDLLVARANLDRAVGDGSGSGEY